MPSTIRFALPLALLVTAATSARAQSQPREGGYRWQVATTDVVLMGAGFAGFALEGKDGSLNYVPSNGLMTVGITGYFLGAPVVHAFHGHYGRAGLSLLLRVVLPLTGGALGMGGCTPEDWVCTIDGMGKGMRVGAVAAAIVDSALIARDPVPVEGQARTVAAPQRPAGVSLWPRLVAAPNLAMVGLGGQF